MPFAESTAVAGRLAASYGDSGATLRQDAVKGGKLFLRRTKTGTDVLCPLPREVLKALNAIGSQTEYFFWSGKSKPKSAVGDYQRALSLIFEDAKTPRVFPHLFRHTCITNWLSAGVPVETAAVLAGHSSIRTTMKHYSHWIKSRQDNLEIEVKKSWAQLGTLTP
jgi:integrase/recombinase XerD